MSSNKSNKATSDKATDKPGQIVVDDSDHAIRNAIAGAAKPIKRGGGGGGKAISDAVRLFYRGNRQRLGLDEIKLDKDGKPQKNSNHATLKSDKLRELGGQAVAVISDTLFTADSTSGTVTVLPVAEGIKYNLDITEGKDKNGNTVYSGLNVQYVQTKEPQIMFSQFADFRDDTKAAVIPVTVNLVGF